MDDNRPRSHGRRGRYEAWFLTMSRPDGSAGAWIRYTTRHPVAGPPEHRVWFARFDREKPDRAFGLHAMLHGDRRPGPPFASGGAVLEDGRATGSVAGHGHEAAWDLRWAPGPESLRILPAPLYRGTLAPTRPYTPTPAATFEGLLEVDGERIEVDGWPGQQGHLEGSRHAERWAWAHCSAYEDGAILAALSAQGRRGPFLTPYLTFGALRLDGSWIRLWGGRSRTWGLGTWRLHLRSRTHRVEGEVWAPAEHLLRVRYLDPDDAERWCHNSEVASSRFLVWERDRGGWHQVADLRSDGTTHAEWAGRTPAPGVDRLHREVV